MHFGYEPGKPVLKGLNVHFEGGKRHALVGLSGSGKTTIISLLQRFWLPERGVIAIDGQRLNLVDVKSLRKQISFVSQDAFLFEGSVRDNIRGNLEVADEELDRAARIAHADTFIKALPAGYNTRVGELGSQLSGGQRQRIAIARAVLRDAPIVLLDEATSSLDSETEAAIQAATNDLLAGKTSIIIAHRLATVLSADRIHVVSDGRLAEAGTHQELLELGGLYSRLYSIQFDQQPPLNVSTGVELQV